METEHGEEVGAKERGMGDKTDREEEIEEK